MRFLVCIISTIIISNLSFSQLKKQISFGQLTVEKGLSQNSVVSIAQDSIGYMWFATQDGLNKYDGRNFVYYDKQFEDVTESNYSKLGKIYADKEGNLWIIRNSGVLELFNVRDNTFTKSENLNSVSVVFQDDDYNLYFGKYGDGLIKVSPKFKDTIQLFKGRDQQRTVYDILQNQNKIFAATSGAVFSIDENQNKKVYETKNSVINYSSLAIRDTILWSGSYGQGLFFLEPTTNKMLKFKGFESFTFPNDLNIQDLLVDYFNRIWVATYGNGVYLIDFENQIIENFTVNKNDPYALHYNDILSLYQDNTGTIWIGTDGAGLSYYDEHLSKFNVLTNNQIPNGVNLDVIRAISIDETGGMWLGTSGKGLTFVDREQKKTKTYTTENSFISGDRIMSLLHINDTLLIGHQRHGLDILDSSGKFKKVGNLSKYTIWKIIEGYNNDFWLCTRSHGLINLNRDLKLQDYYSTSNSELSTNNIRTAILDERNNIWVGTTEMGLYKLNNESRKVHKIDKIPYGIKSLYVKNDTLWVGTNGRGIIAYDIINDNAEIYDKTNGLPNNVIYGILPDEKNNLWLSSNKGITKFKLTNIKELRIENYTNYDGLQSLEFNTGAYFKDKLGNIYFGGLNGFNWFNPNQLTLNPVKPKTIISNLEIFNKDVDIIQNNEYKYNENTITFTFSGLHFSQPERNQYRHKLENYDNDWIYSKNNNVAHYTNLPPNNYVFKVKSSNYDGIWNEVPAQYSFIILQPWYATDLAKVVYALLLIIISLSVYKYFKWRWHMQTQLKLEHAEADRLQKLDELKTKLYANISHEFRTPLTLISGPVEKQLKKPDLKKVDKEDLQLIKRSSDRLLSLVNQMLDLSMLDSGHTKLNVSEGNLNFLIDQLVTAFKYKAKEKNISIKSNIDENLVEAWFDSDVIEKIIYNLLSNAVKYSPENQNILVAAEKKEDNLVLSVVNKYEDLTNRSLDKLFERFYQSNKTSQGIGVGLALVKELVDLSKGSIKANSIDDEIKFTVILPIYHTSDLVNTSSQNQFEDILDNSNESNSTKNILNERSNEDNVATLLIVEDNDDVRNFISSIFKDSYQVFEANNGKVGIEKAVKYIPDIIISDVMMPQVNGIDLCNELKYNELTSHIPIVLLTAKSGDKYEIEGLKTGADAYVTKPFKIEKLTVLIDKLLANRRLLKEHYSKSLSINPEIATNSTEREFFNRLKTVLDLNITDPAFKTENFNELMQMSRMQLHRKLKSITGMTTSEFLRKQRLNLSIALLKDTDLSISEIAYKIGFNSPSYFIRSFKEVYKSSPKEYLSTKK